eukprot:TRINITY_DN17941_c0_g1_i1.p1 TRINITY_DN17941_c0_g1~~TRINITY_DN17941_c0_g1_i1.p1  ORF type:complete len:230 (-),score=35.53 TRINITY_DN17941_c0_g1_i1:54-743(-)
MPLYDVICFFKAAVARKDVVEIMASVGRRVYARNGVVTNFTSYGVQPLGYQIKRQGTRFDEAQLMQMTFMAPTAMVNELHVLQQDDRLLRHSVLKHKPFWKEEVIDNQLWSYLVNKGSDTWDEGHEGEIPPASTSEERDNFEGFEDNDDPDLEFAADELDETDLDSDEPEASGEFSDTAEDRIGGRHASASDDDQQGAYEALLKWRMEFKNRQRRRTRTAVDEDGKDDW